MSQHSALFAGYEMKTRYLKTINTVGRTFGNLMVDYRYQHLRPRMLLPLPLSNESNLDPEEAFVAALSSCHMLTFLSIAAKQYVVDSYTDEAIGMLGKNSEVEKP